jgi:hypothetical protein
MKVDLELRQEDRQDLETAPESWLCVDCGINTAPGLFNQAEVKRAFAALGTADPSIKQRVDDRSEVYHVRAAVWKQAGMEEWGGCLCIGCLEKRLGRHLKPKDFQRDHPFNRLPGTPRLVKRRG